MKRLTWLGVVLAACLAGGLSELRAQDTIRMTCVKNLWLDWRTAGNDETLIAEFEDGHRETIAKKTQYEFDDTVRIALYSPTSFFVLSLSVEQDLEWWKWNLSLDVSGCAMLDTLNFRGPVLRLLDVSGCTALTYLDCRGNGLTSLDVSHNAALTYLDCGGNGLTSLDVSHNAALEYLACGGNSLTSLDVSHNAALEYLACSGNSLTSLDVSGCTALTYLICCYNYRLQSLDVSHNAALTYLNCGWTDLPSLDLSHNTALDTLMCCYAFTALDVSSPSLRYLDCAGNDMGGSQERGHLKSLNVSGCTALVLLDCGFNDLISLNVDGCTALKRLDCHKNGLTSLDVSGCTALMELYCDRNSLTSLNVSGCTALKRLDCDGNGLTSLDVSGCTALMELYCDRNSLTSLDVSGCTALIGLNCRDNNLTGLKWNGYTFNGKSGRGFGCASGNRSAGILDAKQHRFDLKSLPGFEMERASNWQGGRVVDGHYLEYDSAVVTYDYWVNFEAAGRERFCLKVKSDNADLDNLWISGQANRHWPNASEPVVPESVYTTVPNQCENIKVTASVAHTRYAKILSGLGEYHLAVGDNRIEITVMAEDSSQRTYTLTVRRLSADAALQSLAVSEGTLEPAFSPEVYDYMLSVPYKTDSIEVFAEARYDSATVSGVGKYSLKIGENSIKVEVRAENGTRQVYTLSVRRIDAALGSLWVSPGSLKPTFSPEVYDYQSTVPYERDRFTVLAEARDKSATVSGNGTYNLKVGDTSIRIVVTAEYGSQQVYTLAVRRVDAALQSLTVSEGVLTPAFSPETRYYSVEVPYETDSIEVFAEARHDSATVSGAGKYGLQVGGNQIDIVVMAEDDTRRVYSLWVRRKERVLSSDATLRVLSVSVGTLKPAFDPDFFNYRVEVPNEVTSMEVVAEPNHDSATVSYVKRPTLATGDNIMEIVVRAEDRTRRTHYKLTVRRAAPEGPGDKPTAVESVSGLPEVQVYAQAGSIHLSEEIGELMVYTTSGLCVYSGHAVVIPVAQPGLYIVRRVSDGHSWKVVVR